MNEAARAALQRLSNGDWDRIAIELARYATAKTRRLRWRTGGHEDLAGGQTPADLACMAIEKVVSGERNWDPMKSPDITSYLRDVVDSLVSNLVRSDDNRLLRRFPEPETGVDPEEAVHRAAAGSSHGAILATPSRTPEEELLAREAEREAELEVLSELIAATAGDKELELVVEALMDGAAKAGEIAATTKLAPDRVYQLLRKLQRRVASRKRAASKA